MPIRHLSQRLNDPDVCAVCGRRAHGLAAGRPGGAAWFCEPCGPQLARHIMALGPEHLDGIEHAAIASLLEELPDTLTLDKAQQHELLEWIVRELAGKIRKAVRDDHAPF